MLKGGTMKDLYELRGQGYSIRGITRELSVSRNSVRKYLRSPGVPQAKQRPRRASKLDGLHRLHRPPLGGGSCRGPLATRRTSQPSAHFQSWDPAEPQLATRGRTVCILAPSSPVGSGF